MRKVGLTKRRRTEKAIIDALLKISEIVHKTESCRQRQKSSNRDSKKIIGDGDCNQSYQDEHERPQEVPVPPSTRTLDSFVSGFNQPSIEKSSNYSEASISKSKQLIQTSPRKLAELGQDLPVMNGYKVMEHSYKRCYSDCSSTSVSLTDEHCKKGSSKRSTQSNKSFQQKSQERDKTENQPTFTTLNSQETSYHVHSAATTILDDQPSSLVIMPTNTVPTTSVATTTDQTASLQRAPMDTEQKQQPGVCSQPTSILGNLDACINQRLETLLKKYLQDHSLLTTTAENRMNIHQQRKTRFANLAKVNRERMINELDLTEQDCNLEYYEKQRELAMLATQQGNHTLSYSIYTNLLHDSQYNYKLRSEILSSRAVTLLLEEKYFQSIDDCTQAIAYHQWNKLAHVVRAACWMIKKEYSKAVDDYSKLFHVFDHSQYVLDLLNLAYEKLRSSTNDIQNEQLTCTDREKGDKSLSIKNGVKPTLRVTSSINHATVNHMESPLVSPTASFMQPSVYLCYPYQAYPTFYDTDIKHHTMKRDYIQQPSYMITNVGFTSNPSLNINPSSSENHPERKHKSFQSIHSNNNALISSRKRTQMNEHNSTYMNKTLPSRLNSISDPY